MFKWFKFLFAFVVGIVCAIFFMLLFYRAEVPEEKELDLKPYEQSSARYLSNRHAEYISLYPKQNYSSSEKIERKAILMRRANAPATVVIAHGFMCNKIDVGFLRWIFDNYNTLTFDFRAHGELTDGQCCSLGNKEVLDVLAAVNFVRSDNDLKRKPVIGYGFSMGASTLVEAQGGDDSLFDALILDSPFDSTENTLSRAMSKFKVSLFGYNIEIPGKEFFEENAFNPYVQSLLMRALKALSIVGKKQINTCISPISPAEAAKYVKKPCFFIACKKDAKVPVEAVRTVTHNACGYRKLWITNGRKHFDSYFYNPEKYSYKVNKFIKKFLDGKYDNLVKEKVIVDLPG